MGSEEERLLKLIREAFQGVTLGGGVGLREGRGLDMYVSAEELAEMRSEDEQQNWANISWEDLNRYSGSLCFFDAEGMRFHLPAFLIADLEGTFNGDLVSLLSGGGDRYFALLSDSQRLAVREYLLFLGQSSEECHQELDRPQIEEALSKQWPAPRT